MGKGEYEVERILEKKIMQNGQIKYFVKWKGYSEKDNTWEPETNLTNAAKLLAEFNEKLVKKPERKTPSRSNQSALRKSRKNAPTSGDGSEKSTTKRADSTATEESGFDKGYAPEKIVGANTDPQGFIKFLIKWKNSDGVEFVTNELARKHCPQLVIKFYEQNIQWEETSQ